MMYIWEKGRGAHLKVPSASHTDADSSLSQWEGDLYFYMDSGIYSTAA